MSSSQKKGYNVKQTLRRGVVKEKEHSDALCFYEPPQLMSFEFDFASDEL